MIYYLQFVYVPLVFLFSALFLVPSTDAQPSSIFAVDPTLKSWIHNQSTQTASKVNELQTGFLGSRYIKTLTDSEELSTVAVNDSGLKPFELSYLGRFATEEGQFLFEVDKTNSCMDFTALDEFLTDEWIQKAQISDYKKIFKELAIYPANVKVRSVYLRLLKEADPSLRKSLLRNVSIPQSIKAYLAKKIPDILFDAPQWKSFERVALSSVAGSCERKLSAAIDLLRDKAVSLKSFLPKILENRRCFLSQSKSYTSLRKELAGYLSSLGFTAFDQKNLYDIHKAFIAKRSPNSSEINNAKKVAGDLVTANTTDSHHIATIFFAGRVLEGGKDFDTAISMYEYAARYKKFLDKEWVRKTMQRLIVLLYQSSDFRSAAKYTRLYKPYARKVLHSDDAVGFADFWLARSLFAQNKKAAAKKVFQNLARTHFSSFYGAMAHAVLIELGVPIKRNALSMRRSFSKSWLYSQFSPKDAQRLDWIKALIGYGEMKSAKCEIDLLRPKGRIEGFYAAKAILESLAGDHLNAIRSLAKLDHYDRGVLPQGIETVFFPIAFRETIEAAALHAGIDPVLPLSIIRQESVFNPDAVSPAGAVGLMQLMPATAKVERRRLASSYVEALNLKSTFKKKRIKRSFLQKPANNIAIGVHHLRSLRDRYKHPVFVMTSYNASPRATKRWKESIPTDDIFYFIESIPYRETQKYVKLVFRNYFYYSHYYYKTKIGEMAMLSPVIEQAFHIH